ncbi:hypothetical protein FQR65_LT16669 [Abscondita terminalis]|nr:hypothetical protein FQR65_LT16669 [Abscondita terminalis]
MDAVSRGVQIQMEAYPQLQSIQNIKDLQVAIREVEENLAASRRIYNSNVSHFNQTVSTYPNNVLAKGRYTRKELFEATEAQRQDVKIDFNLDLNYSYYELNKSLIDDAEFDNLLSELIQLEMQFPQYKRVDSPTINVGGYVSEKFSKHTHKYPMLSLSNAFNFEDLKNFDKNVFKEIGGNNLNYFVEPKIDGLSISIIYKNGKFFKAVTRGDGVIGEDVTENVKQLKSVPDVIDNKEEYFEVRGEIYFPIKEFHKLNFIRGQKDEALFANPRNAAAGTLRQLDSNIVKDRNLDI